MVWSALVTDEIISILERAADQSINLHQIQLTFHTSQVINYNYDTAAMGSVSRYACCAKFQIAACEFQIETMQCTTLKSFCNGNLGIGRNSCASTQ